jgi:hypothetical protein
MHTAINVRAAGNGKKIKMSSTFAIAAKKFFHKKEFL